MANRAITVLRGRPSSVGDALLGAVGVVALGVLLVTVMVVLLLKCILQVKAGIDHAIVTVISLNNI